MEGEGISRKQYWIYIFSLYASLFVGSFILATFANEVVLGVWRFLALIFGVIGYLVIVTQRLRNMGRSERWALLVFIPIINFLLLLYIGIDKGSNG